ncbi:MAG: transcription-repair coupling factor [Bacteroidales bacterium]|nr:transcription-repair coupling factor [Bacteroidales bacterium]MDY5194498.1 transcription-repair coupling factor [Candidatus Aphodosoma sp.]
MNFNDILSKYALLPQVRTIIDNIENRNSTNIEGVKASGKSILLASLFKQTTGKFFVIYEDSETAAYAYNDIVNILGKENIGILPSSYTNHKRRNTIDVSSEILRTDALNILSNNDSYLVISSPEGISELIINKNNFASQRINIAINDIVSQESIIQSLINFKFEQVEFVYQPGQFSQRGSILDIFSYSNELPYRLDFFGDTIDSIRTFDITKQLSIDNVDKISIFPDIKEQANNLVPIFDYISKDTTIILNNRKYIGDQLDIIYDKILVNKNTDTHTTILNTNISKYIFKNNLINYCTLDFTARDSNINTSTISFNQSSQPLFHKNFDIVSDVIHKYITDGYTIYICSDSVKQTDRIQSIFDDRNDNIHFTPINPTIHDGYIDNDLSICCFTDHQIFNRFHKFSLKSDITKSGKAALTLKEINQLQIGDYVVHIDHGVGKFAGLVVINNNGNKQEVIKLLYKNDDVIFVSIHGLHKISKYKGKEGEPPQVNKLGTGAWEKLKERTKNKVKDIARDLIKLYAARKAKQGFQFSADSYLQTELEASFIYEDTPDQAKSTIDIKRDMESVRPMDRLICGDVGFGKTEIAIRAAFKAVTDNKQVAILVPTTVLALQHYKTFTERLKEFPCTIDYLSRAKKNSEVKIIKEKLKNGKIDIIIGTHKLIGKDICFKDLGLLIIDEEQKFGVAVKEKLKTLKVNIDTLTLTATPIPRTLQFSLMGARDLSILTTPPPNRFPVMTEIITLDDETIKEAIMTEINRNGQVFFINNRVQNIYIIEDKIRKLIPNARIAVAHGQMPPQQLEETIIDFINYDYDVLIATSVIESGIDIPNVNTIIVNNAHMFGLSDLHQLRGRVGRSNRKAYCYLIAPENKYLNEDARRRLQAIETFADLGSGFNIAMQDLDIRGAGNILGAEQSGFITDLGYETYQKILNEAITELKDTEFADIFENKQESFISDCNIETDLELLFPNWYIESQTERIALYRELDSIQDINTLNNFRKNLIDRFGKTPLEVENLFIMVQLRWIAQRYGVERLVIKKNNMTAHLISNKQSKFYQSQECEKILIYCTQNYRRCNLIDDEKGRMFRVGNINDINEAFEVFKAIDKTKE